MLIKPVNTALHQKYTFYMKVTASNGQSTAMFGPYYLDVGCTPTSVVFTNNAAFVTNVARFVGDSSSNVYTFAQPTASRSYCTI